MASLSDDAAIFEAYELVLGREPTEPELSLSLAFLQQQAEVHRSASDSNAEQTARVDFCQILFGMNEFVYVD